MAHTIWRTLAGAAAAATLLGTLGACGTDTQADGAAGPTGATSPSRSTPAATRPATTAPATTTPPSSPSPTTSTPSATASSKPKPTAKPSPTKSTPSKPKPSPTESTPSKPKPTAKPTPTKPTPTKPTRTELRRGDKGAEVLKLQQRLSELGYWLGEPNGTFGPLTQQAVWALQKSAGLSRDGSVGPKTQRALDQGVRPSTRLSGNGIDINLGRQIVMIVRDGRVKYILNTSTGGGYEYEARDGGKAIARTPKGTFKVYYTVDGLDHGRLGDMWRPRYFNGGYAVHGSPSIPPYPASHGCARVSNAAMDMIWASNYMPKGGTVLVR